MKARSGRKTSSPEAPEILLAVRAAREYDAAVVRLNDPVDESGDNPKDPRYRLVETLSVLIEAYDREHHSLPEASVIDVIRFLMEQHGLSQKDLPEIGSQGVVSEVLAGRRQLNVRQIRPSPHASALTRPRSSARTAVTLLCARRVLGGHPSRAVCLHAVTARLATRTAPR